jgi:hypothetical protein
MRAQILVPTFAGRKILPLFSYICSIHELGKEVFKMKYHDLYVVRRTIWKGEVWWRAWLLKYHVLFLRHIRKTRGIQYSSYATEMHISLYERYIERAISTFRMKRTLRNRDPNPNCMREKLVVYNILPTTPKCIFHCTNDISIERHRLSVWKERLEIEIEILTVSRGSV